MSDLNHGLKHTACGVVPMVRSCLFPLWEPFSIEEENVRLRSPPFRIDLLLVEASRSFKTFSEMKGVPVDAVVRRILSIFEFLKVLGVNDWQIR